MRPRAVFTTPLELEFKTPSSPPPKNPTNLKEGNPSANKKKQDEIKKLWDAIKTNNFEEAFSIAEKDPAIFDEMMDQREAIERNSYPSHFLVFLVKLLGRIKKNTKLNPKPLRKFILNNLLSSFDNDYILLATDTNNNTALHLAASGKEYKLCKTILEIAIQRKVAQNLVYLRAKYGGTPLEAIRAHFSPEQVKTLHALSSASSHSSLNQHVLLDGGTELMGKIKDCASHEQEKEVIALLDRSGMDVLFYESDYKGNNALHIALLYQRLEIAKKILKCIVKFGQSHRVLSARNCKRHMPHHLLIELGVWLSLENMGTNALKENEEEKNEDEHDFYSSWISVCEEMINIYEGKIEIEVEKVRVEKTNEEKKGEEKAEVEAEPEAAGEVEEKAEATVTVEAAVETKAEIEKEEKPKEKYPEIILPHSFEKEKEMLFSFKNSLMAKVFSKIDLLSRLNFLKQLYELCSLLYPSNSKRVEQNIRLLALTVLNQWLISPEIDEQMLSQLEIPSNPLENDLDPSRIIVNKLKQVTSRAMGKLKRSKVAENLTSAFNAADFVLVSLSQFSSEESQQAYLAIKDFFSELKEDQEINDETKQKIISYIMRNIVAVIDKEKIKTQKQLQACMQELKEILMGSPCISKKLQKAISTLFSILGMALLGIGMASSHAVLFPISTAAFVVSLGLFAIRKHNDNKYKHHPYLPADALEEKLFNVFNKK
ncbi:MAG: hypothetical protein K0S27_985 [Gammaproteobacteria bacterium]|jgi:ankyrin repeat protein|nr:hypothetical protein [Gammaproteobacteria bacterium]